MMYLGMCCSTRRRSNPSFPLAGLSSPRRSMLLQVESSIGDRMHVLDTDRDGVISRDELQVRLVYGQPIHTADRMGCLPAMRYRMLASQGVPGSMGTPPPLIPLFL